MSQSTLAYCGKLPSHGDFLQKNLSPAFTRRWDGWLQKVITNSRNELSNHWLDYYLTSPIWHFVLSPGNCDEDAWIGIMIPSVDKVGRYFPFALFEKISKSSNPIGLLDENQDWIKEKENIVLALLNESLAIEDLDSHTQSDSPIMDSQSSLSSSLDMENTRYPVNTDKGVSGAIVSVLHSFVKHLHPVHSVWCTNGSDSVTPSLLICNELPSAHQYNALLDGNWKKWGWNGNHNNI